MDACVVRLVLVRGSFRRLEVLIMRIIGLFTTLIYRTALWAARADKRGLGPAPACPAPSAETCPHCGQLHPPGPVFTIGGDGVSVEDYYIMPVLD